MVFFNVLKMLTVETRQRLFQETSIIWFPKQTLFLNLRIIGNATSHFVLDGLFELNPSETTGHTNSILRMILTANIK